MNRPLLNLDRLDIQILSLLLEDGRITKTQISERIGLSITPCCKRMDKLEGSGLIKGYHAELNLEPYVSLTYFRVQLTLQNADLEFAHELESLVQETPEIVDCEAVLGDVDYILLFAAKDATQYQQCLEQFLGKINTEYEYRSYCVTKSVKSQSSDKSRWLLSMLK